MQQKIDELQTELKETATEYWLITTSEKYTRESTELITTGVYDKSPFEVFFEMQKTGGVYDCSILFAQQITKEQYDAYGKWEDSL